MAKKKTCICCGTQYEYCPNCGKGGNPSWKLVYDSKECMEIADIMFAYKGGQISEAEAKKAFDKYPEILKKVFENNSATANTIKVIYGFSKIQEVESEEDDAKDVVEEKTNEKVESNTEEKPKYNPQQNRNKNYKQNNKHEG